MRKRNVLLAALVVFLALASVADASKSSITVALPEDPLTMDPHVTSSTIGWMVWRWSYDSLVASETRTGKIIPWLAEKWKKTGPLQYKFWLRRGVKFADGTPFTAAAVKYSIERVFDPALKGRQQGYWSGFDRLEILDDYTFIWHLKFPDNGLLQRLDRYLLIISPKTKELPKEAFARATFGSGPYVLKSWTKGVKMIFEANPDWWGNKLFPQRPKTVVLRSIKDSTTRVKALIVGEVDVVMRVGGHEISEIKRNPDTDVGVVPGVRIFYLSFANRFGGPFADRNIRLAVNHAIDVEGIARTIVGGLAIPIGQFYHPWAYSGHNPKKTWYGYDLAKARAFMKESSHPNGFKVTLIATHGTNWFDKAACEAIAGMLQKIMIDTTCQAVPFPMYRKLVTAYQTERKDPAMFFRGWGNYADTPNVWRGTSSCKGIWSVSCFKDLDEWNEKSAAIDDPREQQAAFEKFTDTMKERAALRVFFQLVDAWGYRKGLEFVPRPDETFYVWEARTTEKP